MWTVDNVPEWLVFSVVKQHRTLRRCEPPLEDTFGLGRMRSVQFSSRSLNGDLCRFWLLFFACFQAHEVDLSELNFGSVFNHDDTLCRPG